MARVLKFKIEDKKNDKDYLALHEYISGQKELEPTLDAVCEPVESKWQSTQETGDLSLRPLWSNILCLAAATSFKEPAQQRLVDLVLRLQKRRTLEDNGKVCKIHDMTVWKDLPEFGWAIRDAWNFDASKSDEQSDGHWINLNAFTATLLAHDATDDLALSLFGLWVARDALEGTQKEPDVVLAAAATWFVYAGPTLWKFCSQGKTFDGKVAKPGPAFQDNDWRGFTQARWTAWQQRMHDAQGQISDPKAVGLVQQALEALNENQ